MPLIAWGAQIQPGKLKYSTQSGYAADHVLVKLHTVALATPQTLGRGITANAGLDQTLAQAGGRALKPLFAASQSAVKDRSGLGRIYRVDLSAGQSVEDTVTLLAADPNVEYAEPDYLAQKIAAPNDPHHSEQWGLAKIQVEGSWRDQATG